MRVFIAIPIPEEIKQALVHIKEQLQTGVNIKWVELENYHLTLKFLGEVEPNQIKPIAAGLQSVASTCPAYNLSLQGVGFFPDRKRARVVWVGIKKGSVQLGAHARLVDEALHPFGFPRDKKPAFHLTLGRVRTAITKAEFFQRVDRINQDMKSLHFPVDRFFLMESRLLPSGPQYSVLEEYKLA